MLQTISYETSLGFANFHDVRVKVTSWGGEKRLDIRKYQVYGEMKYPTKAGISLSLPRIVNLLAVWEELKTNFDIVRSHKAGIKFNSHLGGNVYVSTESGVYNVNIRKWWLPANSSNLAPSKTGIALTLGQWQTLTEQMDTIRNHLKLSDLTPCYEKDDHKDDGWIYCTECNPDELGF